MENTTTRTARVVIGRTLARIDRLAEVERYRTPLRRAWATVEDVLFVALLVGTGALIVLEDIGRVGDRVLAAVERTFVGLALLAMTLLVFDEYLQRELWFALAPGGGAAQDVLRAVLSIEGKANLAVLLMVLVGFTGASLATRARSHLAIDAMERLLSPPAARSVRRITRLVSAGLALVFARASAAAVLTHSQDAFEGVVVFDWLVRPINTIVAWLPGDKYGPGSCRSLSGAERVAAGCPEGAFPTVDAWIDAKYDAGLDPFGLHAFGYVDPGDRFPLWLPLGFLSFVFAVMALRFLAEAVRPAVAPPVRPRPPTHDTLDLVVAGALPGALGALGVGLCLGEGPLILVASLVLVLLGAPLFVAVGVGTVASWALLRDTGAETVVSDMFEATKKLELLSIPFFVLAGNLMTRGAIATRLIEVARAALGWLPGGLGVGAVAACAMFAAISGSSPVTVIAIGGVMLPMLLREGYPDRYAVGLLTASGGLGIIIPPSIPMIVYAIMVSGAPGVGALDPAVLFRAGIGPGLFIASVLSLYTLYRFWPREEPELEPPGVPLRTRLGTLARAVLRGVPSLLLPVLILGGIYGWLTIGGFTVRFTVTEAAAVAVLYALVVEIVVHRELGLRDLPRVFTESAMQMGSLFLLLVISISLNRFFVFEELPERAAAWMLDWVHSPLQFLLAANLFLLALGCVMDVLSAILIVAPLLAPVAAQYGIHPVHFAIVFVVNLEIGYLTPPMGINLFVASSVFDRPLLHVMASVVPFLLLMLGCLAVIALFPPLSLWLAG